MTASSAEALPASRAFAGPDALIALGVLALAVATRLALLGTPASFDEYYHLLAARSWADERTLRIAEGEYLRTAYYTMGVGALFDAVGAQTLAVGRWPSVAAGALAVLALHLWTRARAGRAAGLLVAGLAVFSPIGIDLAQFLRFYALHGLAFLVGAILVFDLGETLRRVRPDWRRIAFDAAGALAAFGVAFYLQLTTAIGLLGVLLWLFFWGVLPSLPGWRARALLTAAATALGLAGLALAHRMGWLETAWALFRFAPDWAERERDVASFYIKALRAEYPTLLPLTALLALAAAARDARAATFCAAVVAVGFGAHSFAGMKAMRYVHYLLPFLFFLWAVGLAETGRVLLRLSADVAGRAVAALSPVRAPWLGPAAVAAAVGFLALTNPAAPEALKLALGRGQTETERLDYAPAARVVAPWAAEGALIAATHELHLLAATGRLDLIFNSSRRSEVDGGEEFVRDPRTGAPIVGDVATMRAIAACAPVGVVVSATKWWRWKGFSPDFENGLAAEGLDVETVVDGDVIAIGWRRPPSAALADAAACAPILGRLGD